MQDHHIHRICLMERFHNADETTWNTPELLLNNRGLLSSPTARRRLADKNRPRISRRICHARYSQISSGPLAEYLNKWVFSSVFTREDIT